MKSYPKIQSVKPLDNRCLLITFQNKIQKLYDCTPLLSSDAFKPLTNIVLFKMVKADPGGYGVSWNDEIDLSESELWLNGKTVEQVNGDGFQGTPFVPHSAP